jgi:hypothetical protein
MGLHALSESYEDAIEDMLVLVAVQSLQHKANWKRKRQGSNIGRLSILHKRGPTLHHVHPLVGSTSRATTGRLCMRWISMRPIYLVLISYMQVSNLHVHHDDCSSTKLPLTCQVQMVSFFCLLFLFDHSVIGMLWKLWCGFHVTKGASFNGSFHVT